MILTLIREPTRGEALHGKLYIDGEMICSTLERQKVAIPELWYHVAVTESPKFKRLLPIIECVPQRSGIRIHAGNTARDSAGCILVGEMANGLNGRDGEEPRLLSSRKTFNTLREQLLQAQHEREPIYIDIVDASPQHLKQNRIYDKATQKKDK